MRKLLNPIETIARRLPDIAPDLISNADEIDAMVRSLGKVDHAGKARILCAIDQRRGLLLHLIERRYTRSEIEAADAECNRGNASGLLENIGRAGQGADVFRLSIPYLGGPISYATSDAHTTAHVFAHYNLNTGKAAVLMVDAQNGVSITNAADVIIPFIQRQHIGRRGIKLHHTRWFYRDSMKSWSEIIVADYAGGNTTTVRFSPLPEDSEGAALQAATDCGIVFGWYDLRHIRRVL